ncbi:flavohemoglobin expression-modulating QEGLA motif protein [Hydrogenimonas urashimensis]|uniref:flavohemoglobin expression-modulating QEGLA motif protein n=1 Tax=Hydrogenimonas urashimensis TaxID=2740515 RepID=UPI00191611E5|nr:flavohemoglobin expression-modulating QEGLA motif protein [Hydrogenimonas urashimensis]
MEDFVGKVTESLKANRAVREKIPGGGRIHIDRQLPFLCLYRKPFGREDVGTDRLVQSEASYITALGGQDVSMLIEAVASTMADVFGTFLILELWSLPFDELSFEDIESRHRPRFRIVAKEPEVLLSSIETLQSGLKKVSVHRLKAEVEIVRNDTVAPPGLPQVLAEAKRQRHRIHIVGLGVLPIYHDETGSELFPLELYALRRDLGTAFKKTFFRFAADMTRICPTHYAMMGRRLVTKAVWRVDSALASIEDAFDFLLQITPVNTEAAWREFKANGFRGTPRFLYRPRPFCIGHMKRALFDIPIDRIEDPTLFELFGEKVSELDRKLTLLFDRDTENFLYESIPVYGKVEEGLLETARRTLELLPHDKRNVEADAQEDAVDAETFADYARKEIDYYRAFCPQMASRVEIRDDIVAGAMVSGGNFLIARSAHFPKHRIEALLHHEIGTHILTYTNGLSQPFKQLHTGLSGYDEMQEGIAVLSEYLCGGISKARLRVLAARVIAVHLLCEGKSFEETFKTLYEEYDFGAKSAFTVTTRVYRGGGLSKDAIYLRGLIGIFDYLHKEGPLEPLFVGKIAAEHIPLIEELQYRNILKKPPLWPRWLEEPEAKRRLKEIREKKLTLLDLIEKGYL